MHLSKLSSAILLVSLAMVGGLSAQSVTIVSGDGQLAPPNYQLAHKLTVLVRNSQGQPATGVAVTWTISSGPGTVIPSAPTTDADGKAFADFTGGATIGNFAQSIITASALGTSTSFTATTSGVDSSNPAIIFAQVQLISPAAGDPALTGSAGSVGATPIKVYVFANGSAGVQNIPKVQVTLIPSNPSGPTISCAGASGYTDTITGVATCNPIFGGQIGSGQYTIDVGGYRQYGPFSFAVTQGQFSNFRITGGNNQTGNPGAVLALQLTARTEDAQGNTVANVPVVWEPVVPNTATITNASSQSDINGNVSASVTLGSTAGTVQVRLRNQTGSVQVLFTLQVNLAITGLSKAAGDNQDAITNTAFAQPLVVLVNTQQGPTPGVQVQFTTISGVTLANNGLASTDAQGRASIAVQAGGVPGPVNVTAAVGNFTVVFNLIVRLPGPQITLNSFFNGAGGQPGGVSPTAVLAIYGNGLAAGLQGCVEANQILGPLPILLARVTVLFTSPAYTTYAPIYAVCNLGPGQEYVVLQTPGELQPGLTSVTVANASGSTTVNNVPVTVVSPGIFETVMSDGQKRAVVQHLDGNYVTVENPARGGERLRAFVTGLGRPISRTGVSIGSNQSGIPGDDASPQPSIVVGVGNVGVQVMSAIYAQYLIGVYAVTFEVPTSVVPGRDVAFAVAASINDQLVFGNPSKLVVQ